MADPEIPATAARYGRTLTPEEIEPSFTVPAFSANKFAIQPLPVGMRIAFGEEAPNTTTTYWRYAVTLSNHDAVQLYRVLQGLLQSYEHGVAAAMQRNEAGDDGS